MADKIKFLTGTPNSLTNKTTQRGQVYFAVDPATDKGTIVFDAPINDTTTRRITMSTEANSSVKDGSGNTFTDTYLSGLQLDSTKTILQYKRPDSSWISLDKLNYLPLAGGTVTGAVNINNTLTTTNTLTSQGATKLTSTLDVTGASKLASTLEVTGQTTLKNQVNISGGNVRIANEVDSTHSQFSTASIYTTGGASIGKQLSAKCIRIDNNQTNKGCTLQFNESLNCMEFIFS